MRFVLDQHLTIDSEKDPWKRTGIRILVAGDPGSGKSFLTAAAFVEPFLDSGGTVVIFQPTAEWGTLKAIYPNIQVIGGEILQDLPFTASHPKLYADAVVESGISLVFYTKDAPTIDKLIDFIADFLKYVMKANEKRHRPIMVVLEEANRYIPLSPKNHPEGAAPWVIGRMIGRVLELCRDARKLGIIPVMITQRPQDLNFPARQLSNVGLLGLFSPQDVGYIEDEVLKPMRKNVGAKVTGIDLASLKANQWVVITRESTLTITFSIKRKSPHGADTPTLSAVPQASLAVKEKVTALGQRLKELLEKESLEESEVESLKRKNKNQEEKISELERKVALGVDLKELLSGSPAKVSQNVEKRLIELETQNQELGQAHTKLQRNYSELQTKYHQTESDLESVRPFLAFIKQLVQATVEDALPKSATPETTNEDRTVRANLKIWLDNPHIPEPARRVLNVFKESPKGAIYTRSELAVRCKYSPQSSSTATGCAYLAKNGLITENSAGVKLNGE